jgi:hypothetical protein
VLTTRKPHQKRLLNYLLTTNSIFSELLELKSFLSDFNALMGTRTSSKLETYRKRKKKLI